MVQGPVPMVQGPVPNGTGTGPSGLLNLILIALTKNTYVLSLLEVSRVTGFVDKKKGNAFVFQGNMTEHYQDLHKSEF